MPYITNWHNVEKMLNNFQIEKQIVDKISSRLLEWAKGNLLEVDEADFNPNEEHTLHNSGILRLKSCVKRFYKIIGKRNIPPQIKFWECGLGQILGGLDEETASVLPYILTAYMYNFQEYNANRFVGQFLDRCAEKIDGWDCFDSLDDTFWGFSEPAKDYFPTEGIGYLLNGKTSKRPGTQVKQLNKFASQFVLKDLALMTAVKNDSRMFAKKINPGMVYPLAVDYLVPIVHLETWRSHIRYSKETPTEDNNDLGVYVMATYDGDMNYKYDDWWDIFLAWYRALKPYYPLDSLACMLLWVNAITRQNQDELASRSLIHRKLNEFSSEIQKTDLDAFRTVLETEYEKELQGVLKGDLISGIRLSRYEVKP